MSVNSVYYECPNEFSGTTSNAGYDLRANVSTTIPPNTRTVVSTGLYLDMPDSMYAQVFSRSGLAVKNWISAEAGVIDASYRGEVGVVLHNYHPTLSFNIEKGDRIAQLVFLPVIHPTLISKSRDQHSVSTRNGNGFGSSGVQ